MGKEWEGNGCGLFLGLVSHMRFKEIFSNTKFRALLARSEPVRTLITFQGLKIEVKFPRIALGYGLDDRGSRVRFPEGVGNFSLHHRIQNVSGAHPTSYPIGTRVFFPGGKVAGA
jgi:hypothetical protein